MTDKLPSVEECLARFLKLLQPVTRTEAVPITDSIGRIAAADVISPINVPSFPRSAMDGYAVRSCDLAGGLPRSIRKRCRSWVSFWQATFMNSMPRPERQSAS